MARIVKDPQQRRQEILDTAMRLFYENGYEQTSIADIARELKVAQGLCYRYFPSKEALFDEAIDQYAALLTERMGGILRESGLSLAETIRQMPTFLQAERDDSFAYKLAHGPQGQKIHDQLSLAVCKKLLPMVQQLLERAKEGGEISLSDTEAAASFCVYGQLGLLRREDLPGGERVRRIKEFLLQLLQIS